MGYGKKMPKGGYGSKSMDMNFRSGYQKMYLAKCKSLFGSSLKNDSPSIKNEVVGGTMGDPSRIKGYDRI